MTCGVPTEITSSRVTERMALETVLDDGITPVRNAGVFENGMIWVMVPPTAVLNAFAIGAGSGLPVTWLGATSRTSCSATP